MTGLYDIIDFLPEFMQGPPLTFILIFIGYVTAKLLAAVVSSSCLPRRADIEGRETMAMPNRWPRIAFWGVWLVFIVLGFNQSPRLAVAINKLNIQALNLSVQLIAVLGAVLLITIDPWVPQFLNGLKASYKTGFLAKVNIITGNRLFLISSGFIVLSLFLFENLFNNLTEKIVVTFIHIVSAMLLAKVFQHFILSLQNVQFNKQSWPQQFMVYYVVSVFIMSALGF